jgi:hypothetical protein
MYSGFSELCLYTFLTGLTGLTKFLFWAVPRSPSFIGLIGPSGPICQVCREIVIGFLTRRKNTLFSAWESRKALRVW